MKNPNEGFYTPDFVESHCTIDLPDDTRFSGEHTPRSRLRTRGRLPNISLTVPKGGPGDKIKLNSSGAPSKTKKKQREYPPYTQYYVQEPSPKKKKKNVLGYVPGYGPVHLPEATVQTTKVPFTGVQLPLIHTKATKGDHREDLKKNGFDKNTIDIMKSRVRDRLINSHVDERALRKNKHQNAKHIIMLIV